MFRPVLHTLTLAAAVLMAVMHSIAHPHPGPPTPPGNLLEYLNAQLCRSYIGDSDTFVTAFYGIYDPATRELMYASAGHNPPRVRSKAGGKISVLDEGGGMPLGIGFPRLIESRMRPN